MTSIPRHICTKRSSPALNLYTVSPIAMAPLHLCAQGATALCCLHLVPHFLLHKYSQTHQFIYQYATHKAHIQIALVSLFSHHLTRHLYCVTCCSTSPPPTSYPVRPPCSAPLSGGGASGRTPTPASSSPAPPACPTTLPPARATTHCWSGLIPLYLSCSCSLVLRRPQAPTARLCWWWGYQGG